MSKTNQNRVLPHNITAEQATLGAMLLRREAIYDVSAILRANDFFQIAHIKIFEAIIAIDERGANADIITVTEELNNTGLLEKVGGAPYVAQLTNEQSIPIVSNALHYAKIVQEKSMRRSLIEVVDSIMSHAYDETQNTRVLIENSERDLFAISNTYQNNTFFSAADIVGKTISVIESMYNRKGTYTGVPSGFPSLDDLTSGFQAAEFIVIGARPSIGKTAFALALVSNIALRQKVPVGFFSLEMSSMAILQRMISSEARIKSQYLRNGMLRPADFKQLVDIAGYIHESPLYFTDTPNMRLLDLRAQARRMKQQHDIQFIIIDYISLITPENTDFRIPRHEQVAEISRNLKSLARELNIPILALSQVSRDTEGKPPTLAHLRESGSIEQDADVVMFLHRDRESRNDDNNDLTVIETELIIAKQRNGPVGTIRLGFIPAYTRFESLMHN